MNPILFLAFNDLSQRKKEVIFIIIGIAIGVSSTLFVYGINKGMQDALVNTVINVQTGHLKILPELGEEIIENSESVVRKIESLPGVVGVAPRILGSGDVRSRTGSMGGIILGVSPPKEEYTTPLLEKIKDGGFIDENDEEELLLGAVVADELNVNVGDVVVLTTTSNGSVFNRTFSIKGIVSAGSFEYDGYGIFVGYEMAKKILSKTDATEILIKLENLKKADEYALLVKKESTSKNIKTWEDLASGMANMTEMMGAISILAAIISILTSAIAIGLLLYTTVKNKIRDIGILKAIGTSNMDILYIFLLEAIIIAIAGIILGTFVGLSVVNYFNSNPIIMTPRSVVLEIKPWVEAESVILANIFMFSICVSAGLYPAIIASRINTIKAIWGG
ncbi:MAG: ABC transporter permease [Candidatus Micrarchaeota archaeon]